MIYNGQVYVNDAESAEMLSVPLPVPIILFVNLILAPLITRLLVQLMSGAEAHEKGVEGVRTRPASVIVYVIGNKPPSARQSSRPLELVIVTFGSTTKFKEAVPGSEVSKYEILTSGTGGGLTVEPQMDPETPLVVKYLT